MTPFTFDQMIVVALVFVTGLLVGMMLLAGGRWKRRYRDEVRRRDALEAENRRLRAEVRPVDARDA